MMLESYESPLKRSALKSSAGGLLARIAAAKQYAEAHGETPRYVVLDRWKLAALRDGLGVPLVDRAMLMGMEIVEVPYIALWAVPTDPTRTPLADLSTQIVAAESTRRQAAERQGEGGGLTRPGRRSPPSRRRLSPPSRRAGRRPSASARRDDRPDPDAARRPLDADCRRRVDAPAGGRAPTHGAGDARGHRGAEAGSRADGPHGPSAHAARARHDAASALGVLAAGAAGMVKGDARGGLAALTGALAGWQAGDRERADRHFADWKAQ